MVSLNEKLTALRKDILNLEIKLVKIEIKSTDNTQKIQELETSLMSDGEILRKLSEKELDNKDTQSQKEQLCYKTYADEINILHMNLDEKQQQIKHCEDNYHEMITKYTNELSKLKFQVECERQSKEIRYLWLIKIIFLFKNNKY